MKKIWPVVIGILMVAALIVVVIWAASSFKNHNDGINTASTSPAKSKSFQKTACEIFTLADAKELLGDTAKGGIVGITTTTKDMLISSCAYKQDDGSNAPVSSSKSASLKIYHPKSTMGIASNKNQFGTLKPKEVENVYGYGQSAYWDSDNGQLNILKANNWYVLSNGVLSPSDRTLDEAKQLADLLLGKL
jgi:hypothetical protein